MTIQIPVFDYTLANIEKIFDHMRYSVRREFETYHYFSQYGSEYSHCHIEYGSNKFKTFEEFKRHVEKHAIDSDTVVKITWNSYVNREKISVGVNSNNPGVLFAVGPSRSSTYHDTLKRIRQVFPEVACSENISSVLNSNLVEVSKYVGIVSLIGAIFTPVPLFDILLGMSALTFIGSHSMIDKLKVRPRVLLGKTMREDDVPKLGYLPQD